MSSPAKTIAFRPRLQGADECLRPTRAEVDLSAVAHNYHVVRDAAGGARVLAVIKADAYGHGVVPVAGRLQAEGAGGFGVALAEEALELREAGITSEIVVLNGVYGGAQSAVLDAGLTPVVYDLAEVHAFHRAARGRPFAVHVKVDTGMARLGVQVDVLERFLADLAGYRNVRVDGVMTHLACADSDDDFTAEQLLRFERALAMFRDAGHRPRVVHAANSAATFRHPRARFDMVRPGLALFGYPGAPDVDADLRPAMQLRTEIISLRELPEGATVGYHGSYRVDRPSRIATVPVGYGDGLMRAHSNRGSVLVGGRRCPIVGAVSMDLTAVDVTDVPGAALGDEVVLLGAQGPARIGAGELARAAGTIPYEVLTNVSRRVPRFYKS
ncbi:MAG: alanine racemase [Polyangiales bacterium]